MIMHVGKGETVILTETDQSRLKSYIGQKWQVEAVMDHLHPAAALISRGELQTTSLLKYLEVVPPKDSPFSHGEEVKITKVFAKTNYRICDKSLIGRIGQIRGYDSRIDYYLIRCNNGENGWFPLQCLIPVNFKGTEFYYPHDQVIYKDQQVTIAQVKRTKFNYGQLLLIDGSWVPATDVKRGAGN